MSRMGEKFPVGRIYLGGTSGEGGGIGLNLVRGFVRAFDSCLKTTQARAPAPHRSSDLLVFLPELREYPDVFQGRRVAFDFSAAG